MPGFTAMRKRPTGAGSSRHSGTRKKRRPTSMGCNRSRADCTQSRASSSRCRAPGDHLPEAAAAGADALLTGEAEERSMALARECGVHLVAAGHHATETFGIQALGERMAARFDVRHVFLDVPKPV